jgi:hypothetical protein
MPNGERKDSIMKHAELAKQLRQRQYIAGIAPREMIDSLSDSQIIDTYITCSCCGVKQINDTTLLKKIITKANSVDEFFDACDEVASFDELHELAKTHKYGVH